MNKAVQRSLCLTAVIFLSSSVLAANWPGWRGTDGTGISTAKSLPITWSLTENIRWQIDVPGYGWSSPIIWGDKIFITTAISDKQVAPLKKGPGGGSPAPDVVYRWEVHCIDRQTGRMLWKQVAAEHKPKTGNHPSNTYASETPVTDGERVYAYLGMVGVFCYDLNGKLVWSKDLGAYKTFANWGSASSPVLDGNRLFILCDNDQKSFLVALDTRTGKELWNIPREEKSTWSTPIIWRNKIRTELVVMGSSYNRGYDPATGKELWRCASERSVPVKTKPSESDGKGKGGGKTASGGCKASPVAGPDMLYVGMSSKSPGQELGPMWAIKPGATGDISLKAEEKTNASIAWFRDDAGPHFTSAVLYRDRLYVFPPHDRGVLNCFDAKTGATLFQFPLPGASGFKASPFAFDGKIFCTDESGTTFVIEAGPQFKLISKNQLETMTWASPALADGAVYLRTVNHLVCLTNKTTNAIGSQKP